MTASASGYALVTHLFHHPDARALADPLRQCFSVLERTHPPTDIDGFYLWAADDHLELRRGGSNDGVWVPLPELLRRAAQGSELRRACGPARTSARVLDAMAGWGVDGLVLAGGGCAVTMVERHPALVALQQDLVRRSGLSGVECRSGDGFAALAEAPGFDVVYLDPMFPARHKGALPGKRLQWLAALTEPDPRPLSHWLDAAVARVRGRVVLKRRRKDPAVMRPDWQILGRTVRYDVYRGKQP
jgi:16S rRNA (guanine1516-N2)-methyltransferase